MCSIGVCLGVWLLSFMNVMSSCNGVFDSRRIKSVSVVILSGMRLSTTIFKGRMSCVCALELSITKMFSCFNSSIAGNLSGILNGIFRYLFDIFGKLTQKKREKMNLECEIVSFILLFNKETVTLPKNTTN